MAGEAPRIAGSPRRSALRVATSRFRAWCSRALRIDCSRRSRLNGFSMKSWTPSRRASTVSLIDASPEMMMVGGKRCAAASRRTRSTPLIAAQADVEQQQVGEGGAASSRWASASSAEARAWGAYPSSRSWSRRLARIFSSSSTINSRRHAALLHAAGER